MKTGIISLVGRPNVGKSTLLNSILKTKLAITSDKVGTTRNVIHGIYNDDDSQIVFVDTPGIAKPLHKLNNLLNKKAYTNTEGIDIILFLVDVEKDFGKGDMFVLDKIKDKDVPIFLVLTKIDKIKKPLLLKKIDKLKDVYNFKEIIPISAVKKENIDELLKTIKKYLPQRQLYYSKDEFTNVSLNFLVSELVREKILMFSQKEVPHTVTCYTEEFIEEKDVVSIRVLIVVDRDSIKKIIIGKNGSMLKKVGTSAREDIEKLLNKKVYLTTYVKTINNWRDREKYFQELGLKDEDE